MAFHLSFRSLLLVALCSASINANRFCDLWASEEFGYDYDLIAVTDDANYGVGREEDMTLVRAFRALGREATVSL